VQSVEIKVTKRNGDVVNYDYNKIRVAIKKAMESTGDQDEYRVDELGGAVSDKILNGNKLDYSVEEIQDIVEDILISYGESQIAKNYIIYRDTHNKIRDSKKLMIDIDKTIGSYMDRSDWRVNENASTQWSLGGLIMHNSGTVTANYWLNNIYPKAIADAHRSCAFHIHDLSMLSPYCSGNNLLKLIKEGFGGVPNKIDCAPAKHLNTI
jgi:ribonucleoside-triphosphate reductase